MNVTFDTLKRRCEDAPFRFLIRSQGFTLKTDYLVSPSSIDFTQDEHVQHVTVCWPSFPQSKTFTYDKDTGKWFGVINDALHKESVVEYRVTVDDDTMLVTLDPGVISGFPFTFT